MNLMPSQVFPSPLFPSQSSVAFDLGLRAPVSLSAMLAGPLEVLVGAPMPDRSKVRARQRAIYRSSRFGGFAQG